MLRLLRLRVCALLGWAGLLLALHAGEGLPNVRMSGTTEFPDVSGIIGSRYKDPILAVVFRITRIEPDGRRLLRPRGYDPAFTAAASKSFSACSMPRRRSGVGVLASNASSAR